MYWWETTGCVRLCLCRCGCEHVLSNRLSYFIPCQSWACACFRLTLYSQYGLLRSERALLHPNIHHHNRLSLVVRAVVSFIQGFADPTIITPTFTIMGAVYELTAGAQSIRDLFLKTAELLTSMWLSSQVLIAPRWWQLPKAWNISWARHPME